MDGHIDAVAILLQKTDPKFVFISRITKIFCRENLAYLHQIKSK